MSYLGNSPGIASHRVVTPVTATSGQTLFTPSNGYLIGYVDVFLNGVKLVDGDDYTATNGSTVTLTVAAVAGDNVELVAYRPRGLIIDSYAKSESDARYMSISSTTTNIPEGTNLYFTNARARSAISIAGSGSYDSSTGVITISGGVTSVNSLTGAVTLTTTNISEGTNLYFTNARARSAISVTGSGSYDSNTGVITVTGGVTSVNTLTGAVTLTTTNISEGTNLYYTSTRANNDFDTRLATKSTTNIAEGTNLYYTNTRVDTRISNTSINALSDVDTTTSAPSNGQGLIWNSTTSQWVPGNVSANLTGSTTRTLTTITATSGQTTFTASGGYTVGYVDVYQNGIKLVVSDDFTATNGTTVVLTQGANVGDTVEIVAYQLATVVSTAGPKAGGGIIVNRTTIDESYTFPSGHNGFSLGPLVINSGVVVSLPSNQRWVVI